MGKIAQTSTNKTKRHSTKLYIMQNTGDTLLAHSHSPIEGFTQKMIRVQVDEGKKHILRSLSSYVDKKIKDCSVLGVHRLNLVVCIMVHSTKSPHVSIEYPSPDECSTLLVMMLELKQQE